MIKTTRTTTTTSASTPTSSLEVLRDIKVSGLKLPEDLPKKFESQVIEILETLRKKNALDCDEVDFIDAVYAKSRIFSESNRFINVRINRILVLCSIKKCIGLDNGFKYKETSIIIGVILFYLWNFITPIFIIKQSYEV